MSTSASDPPALDSRFGSFDFAWAVVLFISVAIVALTATTPWMGYGPRILLDHAFDTLCHQRPDRSFQIDGIPFAVCHRCFGIYAGIVIGLLARPIALRFRRLFEKHAIRIVSIVILVAGLDWGLGVAGVWENTPLTRMATGLALGVSGGLFLAIALSEMTVPRQLRNHQNRRRP